MKNIKFIRPISCLALLMAAVATVSLTSCNEDNEIVVNVDELTPLQSPTVVCDDATAYTLSFSWSEVPEVSQYGYALYDSKSKLVSGGVSVKRTVKFSSLSQGARYSFHVWAMPAIYNGVYSNSSSTILECGTLAITQLAAPVVTYSISGLQCTLTWDPVENADYYYYTYDDGGSKSGYGSTSDTSIVIRGLSKNEYTVSVYAQSDSELYETSEPAVITFQR